MTPSKHRKTTWKNNRNPSREYTSNKTENKMKALFGSEKHLLLVRKEKNNSGLHSDSHISQQIESGIDKDNVPSGMKIVSSSRVIRRSKMLPRVAYNPRRTPPNIDDGDLINDTESSYFGDTGGKKKRV